MVMSPLPLLLLILSGALAEECCGPNTQSYDINAYSAHNRIGSSLDPWNPKPVPAPWTENLTPTTSPQASWNKFANWMEEAPPVQKTQQGSWKRAIWPMQHNIAEQHERAVLDLMNPQPRMETFPRKMYLHHTHKLYFMNSPFPRDEPRADTEKPKKDVTTTLKPVMKITKQEIIGSQSLEKKVTGKRTEEEPTVVEQILDKPMRRRYARNGAFRLD